MNVLKALRQMQAIERSKQSLLEANNLNGIHVPWTIRERLIIEVTGLLLVTWVSKLFFY